MTRCGAYNSSKPSGREVRHVVIEHDLLDIGAFLFGQFVPFGLGLGLGGLNFEPSIYDLSAPLSVSLCLLPTVFLYLWPLLNMLLRGA